MKLRILKNIIREELKKLNERPKVNGPKEPECYSSHDCPVDRIRCINGVCVEEDFGRDALGNKGTYGKPEWKCKCARQVAGSGHPELGILPTIEVGCASWCCESGATIC